ncbi:hypothetical protein QQF64_008103 [Cirrhinus molitorella]|uniref:Uncharacterized protein n=1 Tax=Cirrhinus molitorella TaxID=172907 RepID=A0ABR3M7Q4_9TELE
MRNEKAEPKVVHYERLKAYRSRWIEPALTSTGAGQAVDERVQGTMHSVKPPYTALSGSLPLSLGGPMVGENETPVLPSVPHVRRPSGRMTQVPHVMNQPLEVGEHATSLGGEHVSKGVVTRSGRVIKRPTKFS